MALDALRRLVPFVQWLARAARTLALVGLAGGVAIWWALEERVITYEHRTASLATWAVGLALPPLILFVAGLALRQLALLPDHLSRLPQRAQEHLEELRRLGGEARRVRERGRVRSMVSVIRLGRQAAATSELMDLAAPIAFLFSPWGLTAVVISVGAAIAEVVVGAIMLLWLVAT